MTYTPRDGLTCGNVNPIGDACTRPMGHDGCCGSAYTGSELESAVAQAEEAMRADAWRAMGSMPGVACWEDNEE